MPSHLYQTTTSHSVLPVNNKKKKKKGLNHTGHPVFLPVIRSLLLSFRCVGGCSIVASFLADAMMWNDWLRWMYLCGIYELAEVVRLSGCCGMEWVNWAQKFEMDG